MADSPDNTTPAAGLEVVSNTAGGTVGAALATLGPYLGVHDPLLALTVLTPGAALAGSLGITGTRMGLQVLARRWRTRDRVVEMTAKAAGLSIEDLLLEAGEDPVVHELLEHAARSATEVTDEDKLRLIADAAAYAMENRWQVDDTHAVLDLIAPLRMSAIRYMLRSFEGQQVPMTPERVMIEDPILYDRHPLLGQQLQGAGLAADYFSLNPFGTYVAQRIMAIKSKP